MDQPGPARILYTAGLAAFALAFAAEALGIAHWTSELAKPTDRAESRALELDRSAGETAAIVRGLHKQSDELEFLQSLPNVLPQDKGYLRTQNAISGEVGALRQKVGKKLKGVLHIVVDAKTNKLYLKQGFNLLWQADCSVGRGGMLKDKRTGRKWEFVTPRGEFKVLSKGVNPKWRKPDWAYAESRERIPPPDDPSRYVEGELGAYVLNLGDGYLIHGTKNEARLGRPASHGCVRLGADDLKNLYERAPVGTRVFIFY